MNTIYTGKVLTTIFLGLACGSFLGCSLMADPSVVQCEETADCADLANGSDTECLNSICVKKSEPLEPADPVFGCIDDDWPTPVSEERVMVTFNIKDLDGEALLPDIEISACSPYPDPECGSPIDTQISDENGEVKFELANNFRGFFKVPTQNPYSTNLLHLYPPPNKDIPETQTLGTFGYRLTNMASMIAAGAIVGETIQPGTGLVKFSTRDCSGKPLAGVEVSVSPSRDDTRSIYLSEGDFPVAELVRTTGIGLGAVGNIDPGAVTVTAVHEDFGQIFEETVIVRPDSITTVRILPHR